MKARYTDPARYHRIYQGIRHFYFRYIYLFYYWFTQFLLQCSDRYTEFSRYTSRYYVGTCMCCGYPLYIKVGERCELFFVCGSNQEMEHPPCYRVIKDGVSDEKCDVDAGLCPSDCQLSAYLQKNNSAVKKHIIALLFYILMKERSFRISLSLLLWYGIAQDDIMTTISHRMNGRIESYNTDTVFFIKIIAPHKYAWLRKSIIRDFVINIKIFLPMYTLNLIGMIIGATFNNNWMFVLFALLIPLLIMIACHYYILSLRK